MVFTNNQAASNGGAIFNDTDAKLTVDGGIFSGNVARNGGAIANYGTVTISGKTKTIFRRNSATFYGGVYFGCGTLDITGNAQFISNYVTGDGSKGGKGGAIYNDVRLGGDGSVVSAGKVTITGSLVFNGNKAAERGGAIQNYSELTITPDTGKTVKFVNNVGGAIDVGQGGSATLGGSLTFGTKGNANTAGYGGAIFMCGDSLTFNEGGTYRFAYNSADYGGAIANSGYSTLTLPGVSMTDNTAVKDGGAIFNDYNAKLTIVGGTFSGNVAVENGGAFANNGSMTISGKTSATISANHAAYCGGAYYGYGTFSVTGVADFIGNYVTDKESQGGAIYSNALIGEDGSILRTGVVSLTGTTSFVGNKSFNGGGAIMSYSTLTLKPESGNSATFSGNDGGENGNTIDVGLGGSASFGGNLTFIDDVEGNGVASSTLSKNFSKSAVQVDLDVVWVEPDALFGEFDV